MSKVCKRRFSGPLRSTNLGDGNIRVDERLLYFTDIIPDGVVVAEAGFISDGPSIPWLANLIVPRDLAWTREAVIHDKIFEDGFVLVPQRENPRTRVQKVTRNEADKMLAEALHCHPHVSKRRKWAIYLGLRLGSWTRWKH